MPASSSCSPSKRAEPTEILVVDDEIGWVEVCRDSLAREGHVVTGAGGLREGKDRLREQTFDLLLVDLKLPDGSGLDLIRVAVARDPDLTIVMITAFPTIETAVDAVRLGAYDYLVKPFSPQELRVVVARALERRRLRAENRLLARRVEGRADVQIVGESEAVRAVLRQVAQVAPTDSEVLILGESGTGKELVARAIHAGSGRRARPFVPVDCGALPESLVESELFGHERGSFTGADRRQIGLFEYAAGGTLLFDEIGELPVSSQAKLLRVLQERRFRRVGGRQTIEARVRVIAATNRDLRREIEAARFRADLFYRLDVFEIRLPPLRERPADVPQLASHLLALAADELGRAPLAIEQDALETLRAYRWPGNVRELRNTIKRAAIVAGEGPIAVEHLPPTLLDTLPPEVRRVERDADGFHARRTRAIEGFERDYLSDLLRRHGGRVSVACAEAGLSRSSMYFLLQRHGLKPATFRDRPGATSE